MDNDGLLIKITETEGKARAMHERLDNVEKRIEAQLKDVADQLRELSTHMNKSKGATAALMIIAGLLGGVLTKLFMR